jgi:hypothetical protein
MKNIFEIDWDKVRTLYNEGLTDRAIGKKFKCGYRPIYAWRHENNLPANHIGRKQIANSVLIGVGVAAASYVIYKKVKEKKHD